MLKFTDDHEWLRIEGGVATVGITAHATEQLGDLVFIDLPEEGAGFGQRDRREEGRTPDEGPGRGRGVAKGG